jgi:hypothetical protein
VKWDVDLPASLKLEARCIRHPVSSTRTPAEEHDYIRNVGTARLIVNLGEVEEKEALHYGNEMGRLPELQGWRKVNVHRALMESRRRS